MEKNDMKHLMGIRNFGAKKTFKCERNKCVFVRSRKQNKILMNVQHKKQNNFI
jgi:hypothetical protein